MFLLYKFFYREYGIRYIDRMINLLPFKLTEFPKDSLFHAVPTTPGHPDVDMSQLYFQNYPKKILLDHVTEYPKTDGVVRTITYNLNTLTQLFRQGSKKHWQTIPEPYKADQSPNTLVVMNYGYLDVVHKYQPVAMAPYYRWLNRQRAIYAEIEKIAQSSARHQFLIVPVPPILQGRAILDKYSREPASLQSVRILGEGGEGGFMLLDLWMWISQAHRSKSLLGTVKTEHLKKVNLVFQGSTGDQSLLNLGFLNSWIKGQPNDTEFGQVTQFDETFVQKLLLKLFMGLNAVSTDDEAVETGTQVSGYVPIQPTVDVTPDPVETKSAAQESDQPSEEAEDENDGADDTTGETKAATADLIREVTPTARKLTASALSKDESVVHTGAISSLTASMISEVEKDIDALDRINLIQLRNSGKSLTAEESPTTPIAVDPDEVRAKVYAKVESSEALKLRLHRDAETNLITAADYRKMVQAIDTYRASEDPYGSKQKRIEAMVITPEHLAITKEEARLVVGDAVPDKSMAEASLNVFDSKYINTVYKKDVLRSIDSLQSAGVVVRNHEIDVSHSALGSYEHHTLELKPIDGAPSSIRFTLPIVDEDGTFMAGGNKYLLRKQRVDANLRKIGPRLVALSTYYGKTFVQTNTKVTNDSLAWLYRQINLASLTPGALIHEVNPGNVYDNDLTVPFIYGALSQEYSQFMVGESTLFLDHTYRKTAVNPELLALVEKDGRVWCGWSKDLHPIVVDQNDQFFEVSKHGETPLGNIYEFLQLDVEKKPFDFSEVRVFSKYIPTGVVLGYYLGFTGLMALLGVNYRRVEPRKNKQLQTGEFAIVFKDETCVFSSENRVAAMILAGFLDFDKLTKLYNRIEFDNKGVYLNLLMSKKINAIYVRELDMLETAFVDPISREILESLHEPVTFTGLLVRGTEMLTNYSHPSSQDRSVMRDRGYERFAGAVYRETMQAVRQFRNKNLIGRSKIDMSPFQVWNAIMKDNSLKIVEDTNPIQNLKESEVITFAGTGGRDKDTMTKPTRAYHPNDVGILSESTVDSSGVGTIAYLSANPNIDNVRGLASTKKVITPTSLLSTSALVSPASTNDSPKRIMFIATQHSHTIASPGYRQPYIRTGYESVIGQRTGKLFSTAAQEDGKVTSKEDRGLIVTYKSGKQVGIELGRVYGKAEGTTYPHDVMSPLSVGDSFKRGDILAYNTKFFEPDFIDPKNIVLKMNHAITTAMIEANQTHEDSCSISSNVGSTFTTEVTKVKSFVVRFTQNLVSVRKVGEKVGPKDILLIIEDEITANTGAFSDDALSTLKRLSNIAPRAGVLGVVEKIEVFYNGDKRDMSLTLKKLADRSDSESAEAAKASNRPVVSGKVSEEYRVSGTPLELDQAELRIYMTVVANTGVGDKGVFAHQMKCTIAEVQRGDIHTEDGVKVDATFSYRSVAARGVLSPSILGTTISLLDEVAKQATDAYFGTK